MNEKKLDEMAVKKAFFYMDFCPSTRFWEVMEQQVLGDIAVDAQLFIDELGINVRPIDQYVIAEVLWDMDKESLEQALLEIE